MCYTVKYRKENDDEKAIKSKTDHPLSQDESKKSNQDIKISFG